MRNLFGHILQMLEEIENSGHKKAKKIHLKVDNDSRLVQWRGAISDTKESQF